MRVRWFGCGLLLLSSIFAGRGLLACGDKYFVTVQGTRYLLASMTSDSNILIYNRPGSEMSRLFAGIPVEKTLTRTGFLTTVVTNENDLKDELAKGGWTIIMVGAADAEKMRSGMPADIRAAILPVVDNATSVQITQIKAQYPVVLKATTSKSEPLLSVIFEFYSHRPKPKVQLARTGSR
ncbi:MAG TPA: hypothetical protein VK210_16325 [Terriglobia bacterium]|nr:hypothetical protein [Terriglobia bacterium]